MGTRAVTCTAENEPAKNLQNLLIFPILLTLTPHPLISTFWLGAAAIPRAPKGPGRADGAPEGRCVRARRSGRAPDGQVDGGWTGLLRRLFGMHKVHFEN